MEDAPGGGVVCDPTREKGGRNLCERKDIISTDQNEASLLNKVNLKRRQKRERGLSSGKDQVSTEVNDAFYTERYFEGQSGKGVTE